VSGTFLGTSQKRPIAGEFCSQCGQRGRYIAPVSLSLLVEFLMLFVFSLVKPGGNIFADPANAKATISRRWPRGLPTLRGSVRSA
jgi:hypothetical protein